MTVIDVTSRLPHQGDAFEVVAIGTAVRAAESAVIERALEFFQWHASQEQPPLDLPDAALRLLDRCEALASLYGVELR